MFSLMLTVYIYTITYVLLFGNRNPKFSTKTLDSNFLEENFSSLNSWKNKILCLLRFSQKLADDQNNNPEDDEEG